MSQIRKTISSWEPWEAKTFLGLHLTWYDNDSVSLHQNHLIFMSLEGTGTEQTKRVGCPINANTLADEAEYDLFNVDENSKYWGVVGVWSISQRKPVPTCWPRSAFCHRTCTDWRCPKGEQRRENNGTSIKKIWGIALKPGCDDQLTTFVDATWGKSFEKNRNNRTEMLVKYENTVVKSSTNLQNCVSLSLNEAE